MLKIANAVLSLYNMPKEKYNMMCKNAADLAQEFDYKKLTEKLINSIEDI